MHKFLIALLLISSIGCSSNKNKSAENAAKSINATYPVQPLIIESDDDEGWGADIRLSLTQVVSADSANTYRAVSSHEGKNVGIEFILPKSNAGKDKSPTQVLMIKSCGENSDNLLMILTNLYKLKPDQAKHFISSAKLAFVDLNEFAKAKFGKEAIQATDVKEMKLFFETEDPDDYAELYLNINAREHWLEVR